MAGPKRPNVVQYFFEGQTYDLEKAISHVSTILKSSMKDFRDFQENGLTKSQHTQIASLEKMLGYLEKVNKSGRNLSESTVKNTNKTIRQAFGAVERMQKQALKASDDFKNKQIKNQEEIAEVTSLASRASAEQHAKYLEAASQSYRGFLKHEYISDIDNAVADFNVVNEGFQKGVYNAEQLAEAIQQLQKTYYDYNETLRNVKYEQAISNKGIVSLKTFMDKARESINLTLRSFQFWLRMLRKLVQLIKQSITYISDYVESLNFLEVALGGVNDEFRDFITLQQTAFGLDPTAINTAAASFVAFGNSIGFTSDQTAIFAMNMTQLAQDMASLYNQDLQTMMVKLRSALSGQTRAMQAYGISVHDATVQEWLLSKGFDVHMSSMSESAQAYARYLFILEKTADAHGDLGRTLNSPANQLKILAVQIKLLVQNLGTIFTTFLMPFIRAINIVLQPLNAFLTSLFSVANSGFSTSIASDTEALEDETDAVEALKGALTGLDEINQASAGNDAGDALGVPTWLTDLGGSVVYDNMSNSVGKLASAFSALGAVVAPIFDLLISAPFQIVTDWVASLFEGIGWLVSVLNPLFSILEKVTMALGSNGLLRVISAIVIGIPAMIALVALAAKGFAFLTSMVWGTVSGFLAATVAILKNTAALLANVLASIKAKLFAFALTAALWWETAAWWAKAIAVIAAAGALALVVAGIVAAAVGQTKGQAARSQQQTVAPMATGGVVTGPTLALIGEGKHNEAVIPLGNSPQFVSMKQNIANEVVLGLFESGAFSRGQSGTQNIILNMDGRELARTLWPALAATKNQVGVKLT